MYDVLLIGAGITGSLIAYELSKFELKVLVLDKENDIANESTMANSAIVHSGYDPKPNSLKAKLNVEGSRLYPELCQALKIGYKQLGSITVASNEEEVQMLNVLKERAYQNGVEVSLLNGEQVHELEPNLSTHIIAGLFSNTTAIVYPWEVAIAAMEQALLNDVELKLNTEVQDISFSNDIYTVKTNGETYKAKLIINAAGVYADQVGKMINKNLDFSITSRRGSYFVLDKDFDLVSRVIYPTPTHRGKGVLVVPTIHGNTLIGPDSEFIDEKDDLSTSSEAFAYIKREIVKLIPQFPNGNVIRSFTGLRAVGSSGDFYIKCDDDFPSFIHVAGIESPGLASSPAIAKYVLNLVTSQLNLQEKKKYEWRLPYLNLKTLSRSEKNELIKKDPSFGRLVCRCEQITEGEIKDVIHRYGGATTVKGIKKRCRPGMGKCQGGFCEPLIVDILSKELQKDKLEINYDQLDTQVLMQQK